MQVLVECILLVVGLCYALEETEVNIKQQTIFGNCLENEKREWVD